MLPGARPLHVSRPSGTSGGHPPLVPRKTSSHQNPIPPHFQQQQQHFLRPHVPFMYNHHQGQSNNRHNPRPSLSMKIPTPGLQQTAPPKLSPSAHSPSDSRSLSPMAAAARRRNLPIKMPACSKWTRTALDTSHSHSIQQRMHLDARQQHPQVVTRPPHQDELQGNTLPESIDIYLPGSQAWFDFFDQLIADRPLGASVCNRLSFRANPNILIRCGGHPGTPRPPCFQTQHFTRRFWYSFLRPVTLAALLSGAVPVSWPPHCSL